MPSPSFFDLERDSVDPSAVSILPFEVWHRLKAIGVDRSGGGLIVAMADPTDERAIRELELRTGLRIFAVPASETTILEAIERSHEDA